MKFSKRALSAILVAALGLSMLAGCTDQGNKEIEISDPFTYSTGMDENGFWTIRALDYVEMFDYDGLSVPKESHEVTDEEVQTEIDTLLTSYSTDTQITDRAVAEGDAVNIDYVGTVDGVEFEGGNTNGGGTQVVIGETSYIDNFIDQLVGHMPGETFDISVTFPEDYGNEELNGKPAVFVTTINYIAEPNEPELNDAFVSENLSEDYGWTTVDEMKNGLREDLQKNVVQTYVQNYLANDVTVNNMPQSLITYQEKAMTKYFEDYAEMYGVGMDEFLSSYVGVSSIDELLENYAEDNAANARYLLVIQAVAEDSGMSISDEEITAYFEESMGTSDYSTYEQDYGMPYIKQTVLGQKVLDQIVDNAKYEE